MMYRLSRRTCAQAWLSRSEAMDFIFRNLESAQAQAKLAALNAQKTAKGFAEQVSKQGKSLAEQVQANTQLLAEQVCWPSKLCDSTY